MPNIELKLKLEVIGTITTCPSIAIHRGEKYIIGLRHYSAELPLWTMPGGRCTGVETVEAALRREVTEETGITDLTITDFVSEFSGAKAGDIVYFFIGTTTQEPKLLEPDKFSEWRWESIENVPTNFINPEALAMLTAYAQRSRTN